MLHGQKFKQFIRENKILVLIFTYKPIHRPSQLVARPFNLWNFNDRKIIQSLSQFLIHFRNHTTEPQTSAVLYIYIKLPFFITLCIFATLGVTECHTNKKGDDQIVKFLKKHE